LRFLLDWADYLKRTDPALIGEAVFAVRTAQGTITTLRVSAMRQFLGRERVLVSFLDNTRREIYGQRYIDGPYERLDALVATYVEQTLTSLRTAAGRIPPGSPMEIPLEGDMVAALRAETTRTVGRLPHSRR